MRLCSMCGAVRALARIAAWIEAAVPGSLVAAGRIARSQADRPDMHVAIEDPPCLLAGVRAAAAGQRGHARSIAKLRLKARGKPASGQSRCSSVPCVILDR